MTLIFSIEGNIGSGKSTFVKMLNESILGINGKNIVFIQEPVDVWNSIKDDNGITILEKFYANQEKYAFSFQMMAYISRLHILKTAIKKHPHSIIITERSIFTDKEIFAKMLYDDNKIEQINYHIYLKWFDEFIKDVPLTGIIYIKTTPEKSLERVNIRAREGENIPIEYLKKCHDYHENWINNINLPVKILDGNIEFINEIPEEWRNNIIHFIAHFISSQNVNIALDTHYC
jgi:deoxycitidine kinase/deoxyguanosine kinase